MKLVKTFEYILRIFLLECFTEVNDERVRGIPEQGKKAVQQSVITRLVQQVAHVIPGPGAFRRVMFLPFYSGVSHVS